ncbi:MAG TPA: flagellin [Rhodocyclaceae bacterium]|nr:flagellin [Rhodocyclaceae bacterium]
MLSLNTNAAALTSQNSVSTTQKQLSTSMTRLGTGYRINSAMDDAAGLQIATRLNAQTRGMAVAQRNTQNGISMMQTAEGALNEVSEILLRMKDLTTESLNGTSSTEDVAAMQAEFDALGSEMDNILTNTSFGGTALFGAGGSLTAGVDFQIGASDIETMTATVSVAAITKPASMGSIDAINTIVNAVGTARSELGAYSNRLEHVYNNLSNMRTNTEQARGRIMDVDYATETSNMTTKQMLMQASTSMLKQSGSMSQLVMSLMQ